MAPHHSEHSRAPRVSWILTSPPQLMWNNHPCDQLGSMRWSWTKRPH